MSQELTLEDFEVRYRNIRRDIPNVENCSVRGCKNPRDSTEALGWILRVPITDFSLIIGPAKLWLKTSFIIILKIKGHVIQPSQNGETNSVRWRVIKSS